MRSGGDINACTGLIITTSSGKVRDARQPEITFISGLAFSRRVMPGATLGDNDSLGPSVFVVNR